MGWWEGVCDDGGLASGRRRADGLIDGRRPGIKMDDLVGEGED